MSATDVEEGYFLINAIRGDGYNCFYASGDGHAWR